ncbi:MAG: SGNH hydrolase domain-containing protein, partial [Microcella sp.]|nr:SGNH hydrolase domain-containing protein [Microcella sp.]
IGDSKAMKMYPAIERLALEHGWRMVTFLKGACAFRDAPSADPTCTEFRERLASELGVADRWDLVVTLGASFAGGYDDTDVEQIRSAWSPILANDVPIVVIRDNPRGINETRECVLDNLGDVHVCDALRERALSADAQVAAARGLEGATSIDLTDFYCDDRVCPVAIGGILLYRDAGHINDEYTYTLAPYIADRLMKTAPQLFDAR